MKLLSGPLTSWKLETQGDGRRLAIWALRALEDAGAGVCRADIRRQTDALIRAHDELALRGTRQAAVGFMSILTDRIGAERSASTAAFYAEHFDSWRNWRGRSKVVAAFDWGSLNPGRKMLDQEGGQPEPASPGALVGQNQQTRV